MTPLPQHSLLRLPAVALAVLGVASAPAQRMPTPAPAAGGTHSAVVPGGGPHQHLDGRFAHNHYYYDRGYAVHTPPDGGLANLHAGGERYYYHGGNWYRWRGDRWWHFDRWWHGGWVVSGPPVGLFVPLLPPYYTTVWWGGAPYYYANETYYVWDAGQKEYRVVAPPGGLDAAGMTPAPVAAGASAQLFAYPSKGQSAEQQSRDRAECHQWATAESGYDPTAADAATQASDKRDAYFRAQVACLEARGYAVK